VNIAYRVGHEVVIKKIESKIESYRVTHKGVKPVTPIRG